MTRRTRLGIAGAAVIAGALAITFAPREQEGTMSFTYAGISTKDTNLVLFNLTNTSRTALAWYIQPQVMNERSFSNLMSIEASANSELNGRSAVIIESAACSGKRWRIAVWYDRPISEQFILRFRGKFARFAYDRTWYRLGKWVEPDPIMLWAFGPEMLGNQPGPASK